LAAGKAGLGGRHGPLAAPDAVRLALDLADGLHLAHGHGLFHGVVKPSNVMLADGPDVSVRLLDFGLALVTEEETLTAAGDVPGTLAYISPERLTGKTAGPETDVWSAGVLLWEALAGRHPFGRGPFLEMAKKIGRGAPSLATAEKGRAFFECEVGALIQLGLDMRAMDRGTRHDHTVRPE